MTEKYMFFNSTATDRRRHQASDMAEYWESFLSSGIIHQDGEPQLEVLTDGINRDVIVSTGRALIKGHLYINDSDLIVRIDNPDSLLDRIDRIILRFDNSIEKRYIKAFVLKGETAANPVPPALTRTEDVYEISLAQIRVIAGKSFIEQSDITDERLEESVAGLASSLVSVPSDIFTAEWREFEAEYNQWFVNIQSSAYATVEDVRVSENNMKREIANLNLQLQASQRVSNGVTFGTNFDATFGMSMDLTRSSSDSALGIGTTQIVLRDISEFSPGTEITIYDDVNLERIKITSINENTITLERPTTKSYKEGVNIARSMGVVNLFERTLNFGVWGQYDKVIMNEVQSGLVDTGSTTKSDARLVRVNGYFYIHQGTNIYRWDGKSGSAPTVAFTVPISNGVYAQIHSDENYIILVYKTSNTDTSIKVIVYDVLGNIISQNSSLVGLSNGELSSMYDKNKRILVVAEMRGTANIGIYSLSKSGILAVLARPTFTMRQTITKTNGKLACVITNDGKYHIVYQHYPTGPVAGDYDVSYQCINSDYTIGVWKDIVTGLNSADSMTALVFKNINGVFTLAGIADSSDIRTFTTTDFVTWTAKPLTGFGNLNNRLFLMDDGTLYLMIGGNISTSGLYRKRLGDTNFSLYKTISSSNSSNYKPAFLENSSADLIRPFVMYAQYTGNVISIDGEGVLGYGNEITTNDVRLKVKPTKEAVLWLAHDEKLSVSEAYLGEIPMKKETVAGETQFTGVSDGSDFDEIRFTIIRQSVNDYGKVSRILGGVE